MFGKLFGVIYIVGTLAIQITIIVGFWAFILGAIFN